MERGREGQDGPTGPPQDVEEERQRLLRDAAEAGVDETEALQAAERVSHGTPLPDAYRAVDRRLATGHSVEETEELLVDEVPVTEEDVED